MLDIQVFSGAQFTRCVSFLEKNKGTTTQYLKKSTVVFILCYMAIIIRTVIYRHFWEVAFIVSQLPLLQPSAHCEVSVSARIVLYVVSLHFTEIQTVRSRTHWQKYVKMIRLCSSGLDFELPQSIYGIRNSILNFSCLSDTDDTHIASRNKNMAHL
jgi:hypothetical protein